MGTTSKRILDNGHQWGGSSAGVVTVQHTAATGSQFTAAYGHIVAAKSKRTGAKWLKNDLVRKGERVGNVADFGYGPNETVFPPHLHFGIENSVTSYVDPTSNAGWVHQARGTVNPEAFLMNNQSTKKLSDGTLKHYRVRSRQGELVRNWIPTWYDYLCLLEEGATRWGVMPNRFLNQIPEETGVRARC